MPAGGPSSNMLPQSSRPTQSDLWFYILVCTYMLHSAAMSMALWLLPRVNNRRGRVPPSKKGEKSVKGKGKKKGRKVLNKKEKECLKYCLFQLFLAILERYTNENS